MPDTDPTNPGLIERPPELQEYYRDRTVVSRYLARRTSQPLNGFLHRRQVAFLNEVLRQRAPARVLEVAPGPARLTADLEFAGRGVAIDGSPEMLAVARTRLGPRRDTWLLVHGDAFALPVANASVELAFGIRFVRRFQPEARDRLYAELRRVLVPGGALILDAQNRAVAGPHRQRKGVQSYAVFDQLYTRDELSAEIEGAGFQVRRIDGILHHFPTQSRLNRLRRVGLAGLAGHLVRLVEQLPGGQPSTWMLLAERRP